MSDFRSWPLTSFTALQKCGRYPINSGQTAPSGLTGSAAFDPRRTSAQVGQQSLRSVAIVSWLSIDDGIPLGEPTNADQCLSGTRVSRTRIGYQISRQVGIEGIHRRLLGRVRTKADEAVWPHKDRCAVRGAC